MKVLIISHNPISTYQNMGKTFLSLFHNFNKEELCQLYIYPSVPDVKKCSSYFRITDKEALKSVFGKRNIGREITEDEIDAAKKTLFENEKDESLYRNPKNKKPLRMLLRDDMWRFSRWYNKNLKNWLNREKPTCIFVAPGTGKFLYNIAIKISKKYGLPIVTYICDDYYFVKCEKTFLGKRKLKLLKRKTEQLLAITQNIVTISKELEKSYSEKFNVNCRTIMTGSNYAIADKAVFRNKISSVTYMGNIRCNRYNSLADIGRTLDEINLENETDYKLKIYTGEKNEEILNTLKKYKSIELCGFVSGDEFDRIFHSADMLLHVEAFDEQGIDIVKYSVSTKIADSLGSGICLFAYAPNCVSSMKHLIDNRCAICAVSENELKSALINAFNNENLRDETVKNALITAHKYHDENKISAEIYSVMTDCCK